MLDQSSRKHVEMGAGSRGEIMAMESLNPQNSDDNAGFHRRGPREIRLAVHRGACAPGYRERGLRYLSGTDEYGPCLFMPLSRRLEVR
jgi:hypothetical protein